MIIQKLSKEVCSFNDAELKKSYPMNPKLVRIINSNITELEPPNLCINLIFRLISEIFFIMNKLFII